MKSSTGAIGLRLSMHEATVSEDQQYWNIQKTLSCFCCEYIFLGAEKVDHQVWRWKGKKYEHVTVLCHVYHCRGDEKNLGLWPKEDWGLV